VWPPLLAIPPHSGAKAAGLIFKGHIPNFSYKFGGGGGGETEMVELELNCFVDAGHCFMLEQVEGWYQVDTLLGLDDLL